MKHHEKTWKAIVEVDQAEILHFPQGMAGFPDANEYVMLNSGQGDITCMQSTERPEAAFLITPWDEHRLKVLPKLTPDQQECLHCSKEKDLLWFLVLNPFTDLEWVLANTRAPVAINLSSSLGIQSVQMNPRLDLHFHWMRQPAPVQQAA